MVQETWESRFGDHGYVEEMKEPWEVESEKIVQENSSHHYYEQTTLKSDPLLTHFFISCPYKP